MSGDLTSMAGMMVKVYLTVAVVGLLICLGAIFGLWKWLGPIGICL